METLDIVRFQKIIKSPVCTLFMNENEHTKVFSSTQNLFLSNLGTQTDNEHEIFLHDTNMSETIAIQFNRGDRWRHRWLWFRYRTQNFFIRGGSRFLPRWWEGVLLEFCSFDRSSFRATSCSGVSGPHLYGSSPYGSRQFGHLLSSSFFIRCQHIEHS